MLRSRPRLTLGMVAAVLMAAAVLHGCTQETTEPSLSAGKQRYRLIVGAGSSTANGVVTANKGGVACTVVGGTGGAEAIGTCTGLYPAGTVVSVTASPGAGAELKLDAEWGQTCEPNVENRRICQVTMDSDRTIAPTFVPSSTSFTLTVNGGAGGDGTVFSTPMGISCTIVRGQASSGNCSAGFPRGTQVKLTARTGQGRRLKAWAGGKCDAGGDGVGSASGACVTTMSGNVNVVVSFDDLLASAVAAGTLGQWDAPIPWPAVAINAALLPNKTVLTYGRSNHVPVLWDPAVPGTFTDLARPADFFCSGFAFLKAGQLIVSGGHSGVDNFGIKSNYKFDYLTGVWTKLTDMQNGRWYPTNTTLPNGQMLTISGGDTAGTTNLIPEVYAPAANTWRPLTLASRNVPFYPMMFVAPDGKVFYVGPEQATAFLSTVGKGSWTDGPPRTCCYRDYGTAVMYDAGKILVLGGGNTPTKTAEAIDLLGAATWTRVGDMNVARRQVNATLLADGKVLVTGGSNGTGFNPAPTSSAVLAPELWDPENPGVWKPLASMSHHRLYHSSALLLADGRVLSVGSGQPAATGLTDDFTAEIFSPPYLFNADGTTATRPVITGAPATVTYGQVFTIWTPGAANIRKVTWIRLSAVTHSFNQNQRMNVLSFSLAASNRLAVTAPSNANLAPPGHYMVFVVNSSGVPSVAKVVRIR
jgi:hypothetical protein